MIGINLIIFMLPTIYCRIRDWSSITGRGGGATKRKGGGGHVKFNPHKKGGGAEKVLNMLKGRHNKFWGSFMW